MWRTLAVAALLTGCGRGTVSCPGRAEDPANPADGDRCARPGSQCLEFETLCTCNDDYQWHCQGSIPGQRDMAVTLPRDMLLPPSD